MRNYLLILLYFLQIHIQVLHALFTRPDRDSKLVLAHFMVGNTYPYTTDNWSRDIQLASEKGIDGFVLNVGGDPWEPARVADAYQVASDIEAGNIDFKLVLSFDMTSLRCSAVQDGDILRQYINTYNNHQQQLIYHDKMLISTFGGENCTFGANSANEGWRNTLKTGLPDVYLVPAFFIDPTQLPSFDSIDGAFNWNSAWPMGNYEINSDSDNQYISHLQGKTYMAGVSPWFFTHYGPNSYNKNLIYSGDKWLLAERWELLIKERRSIDIAQIISWNDYGESHYIGPISGAQPNSESWTAGFDHQGWLDLISYYIVGFKTGELPPITEDKIFMWGRVYPANTDAPDSVGKPKNYQFSEDMVWVVVLLESPAQIVLCCNPSNLTTDLPSGLSKLRLPLTDDCSVSATIFRDGIEVQNFTPPGFTFKMHPPMYNFNAFVAASS